MRPQLTYGRAELSGFRTAIKNFSQKNYDSCVELLNGAAAAFVIAAANQVHVDTGMSAASLRPFGRKVNAEFPINPKRPVRTWGSYMTGKSYRGKIRSIAEGLKAGERAYKINYGTPARPVMSFSFTIKVFQYAFHEFTWQSLMAGEWAYKNYIRTNYDRVVGAPLRKQLRIVFKIGEKRG